MRRPAVAGIDGCRGGWVVVTVLLGDRGGSRDACDVADVRAVTDLSDVVADLESGRLAAAAIDIPIGLPARGPRAADVEARRRLGPRRSSVFPAPVRPILAARDYEDACALSRAVCGKAISKQLFNILGKIREVDALQSPSLQDRLFEMSPELSFATLAGGPMANSKSTAAGRVERLRALAGEFVGVAPLVAHPPLGARGDDVLDAFVGAWTARRFQAGAHVRIGVGVDERGLRMEMIA